MSIAPVSTFAVKWEEMPLSLRPTLESTTQKAQRIAWNILSIIIFPIGLVRLLGYAVKWIAKKLLLPAASHSPETQLEHSTSFINQCKNIERLSNGVFRSESHKVIAPDGAILDVTLLRRNNSSPETPTCIYFNGNNALKSFGSAGWLLDHALSSPMNFVVFDYRSAGNSTGTFNDANDLLVDGLSLVHWVRKTLKTRDDRIHFYGTSLGGAVALKTKALDPKLTGKLLSERSFSSLEDMLKSWTKNCSCLCRPFVNLIAWTLKKQSLELDVAADLKKLKGRILIVYHKNDPVIPKSASLAEKVKSDIFELKMLGDDLGMDHHCAPLKEYVNALNEYEDAEEKISNFLFN